MEFLFGQQYSQLLNYFLFSELPFYPVCFMHKILSEISLRMLIRIFSLKFSSVSRLYSFFLWSQWFCCSWPFPFMPLVFLGCLAIFGCLFIFKVDGLIWSGRCRFPLLSTGGPASRAGSQLQGQSPGGRGRNGAGKGTLWPPPVPEGCILRC